MSSISGSSLSITGSTTLNGLSVGSGTTTLSSVQTGNFSQSGSSTFSTGTGLVSLNGQVTSNAGVVVGTADLCHRAYSPHTPQHYSY